MKITLVTFECGTKERRDEFFKEYYPFGSNCESEPGCIQYEYFMKIKNDSQIFLLERWENDEALKRHMDTENLKKMQTIEKKYGIFPVLIKYEGEEI